MAVVVETFAIFSKSKSENIQPPLDVLVKKRLDLRAICNGTVAVLFLLEPSVFCRSAVSNIGALKVCSATGSILASLLIEFEQGLAGKTSHRD